MSEIIVRIDTETRIAEVFDVERASITVAATYPDGQQPATSSGITNRFAADSLAEALGRLGAVLDEERDHVCQPAADASAYDGIRLREFHVISGIDDADDQEGILNVPEFAALAHRIDPGPAIAADPHRLLHLRALARDVATTAGFPLRVLHFKLDGVEEILPPPTITNDIKL